MTTKPEQPPLSIEERVYVNATQEVLNIFMPQARDADGFRILIKGILRRHFEDLGEARHRLEIKRDEDNGAKLDAVFLNGVPLHHFNRTQNAQAYLEKVRKALTADYDFDGLREQQSAESQRDIQELRLAGVASDHIWAMADGYEPHCIGLRMDSGDSGVVYMTPEQAHDVIDNLNSILWQLLEIPHASEQSTRGFSNISVNGAKVAGAQGSEPTEEQKRACPACSSIIPEEGHAKDCPDPAGEFSPSRTPERRIGPGERRVHPYHGHRERCTISGGDGSQCSRCNSRSGPPDRRRKWDGKERRFRIPARNSEYICLPNLVWIPDRRKAQPETDACQLCDGKQGKPGNENIVDGVIACDYCSVIVRQFKLLSAAQPGKKEGEQPAPVSSSVRRPESASAMRAAGTSDTSAATRCPTCCHEPHVSGLCEFGLSDGDCPCDDGFVTFAEPAPQATAPEHGVPNLLPDAPSNCLCGFRGWAYDLLVHLAFVANHASSLLAERDKTIAQLRHLLAEAAKWAVCSYCGEKMPKYGSIDDYADAIAKHTENCPTHPVNQWFREKATAERLRGLLREVTKNAHVSQALRQRIQKELEGRP